MLINPHDRFFKEMMGDVENAQAFLETYLPPKILQTIDVDTMRAEKDSFIEQDLKEFYADLLFRATIRTRKAYVYILLEHKSYSDQNIGMQLLRYMSAIWDKEIKKQ
ncbi:MAG TPA: Rpn family recombination-promoting nuclease/putative transposase, partial [Thermotogota bacterium]|nr:Rpn family recombination-promoting nuclease/putative transposase [Thermotogota bacterium]HOT87269.1 Rpn family recombination-promoting nuclease/putative transposase [Thermotogota bacterium]HPY47838.1 Rpn family recombination-promoting nuclease/putative transposase [Thermotogota bacterium]HQA95274.1 Rpn family recombination-promoting nuclease/putative transposase [Thermotogota bacterium]